MAIVFYLCIFAMFVGFVWGCESGLGKLERLSEAPLCLIFSRPEWNATNINSTRLLGRYDVMVDSPTTLDIPQSWVSSSMASDPLLLAMGTEDVAFHVQAGGHISFQKRFRTSSAAFPLHSLTITLEDGDITALIWDSTCSLCDQDSPSFLSCRSSSLVFDTETASKAQLEATSTVMDKSCAVSSSHCSSKPQDCNLQVLVTWEGTDKSGRRLLSTNHRSSRFSSSESYSDHRV